MASPTLQSLLQQAKNQIGDGPLFQALQGAVLAETAINTNYTAGTPGNWAGTAPQNVQSALDRMAALLFVLNGNAPIP